MSDQQHIGRRGFLRRGGGLVAGAVGASVVAAAAPAEAASYLAYIPLNPPFRAYDSRQASGPLSAGNARTLVITNWTNSFAAVCVNVTVTETTGSGWLAVFPSNTSWGGTSNINWSPGWTIANNAFVGVDPANGGITILCGGSGSTQFILDRMAVLTTGNTVGTVLESVIDLTYREAGPDRPA